MDIPECANCRVHGWKQLKDVSELKVCSKCKHIFYCSEECQKEHWSKVHKSQCRYFADPSKTQKWRHKEEECVICVEAAKVDEYKIREPDNPLYECIHKTVEGFRGKVYHSHPFPIIGQPEDIREKSIVVLWQLMRKFKLTQPRAAFTCREELQKLYLSLMSRRIKIWYNRKIYPQPEARLVWINQYDLQSELSTIEAKLTILKVCEPMADPFHLWEIITLVMEIALDLDLCKITTFLKDPLSNLPDDIGKLVSQVLKNADKYATVANEVLDALAKQVIPYQDIVKIICGGNLKQTCNFCSEEFFLDTSSPGVWDPCFSVLTLEVYSCSRGDCHSKMNLMMQDCNRVVAAIGALWTEREVNTCDFCFQRTPVMLKNVETRIHRCRNCRTTMYCSVDCLNQDYETHLNICKEDKSGRKKKLGVSARKEEAREAVDRLHRLEKSDINSPQEICEVYGKFKQKNAKTAAADTRRNDS